jgi:multidrug resistance efflux pump
MTDKLRHRHLIIPILAVLVLAAVAGWWLLGGHANEKGNLSSSGTIEAESVAIAAEVGGRIATLAVDEGDEVQEGQLLVQLDTAFIDAQIHQAEAAVKAAEASLARLKAGARPEEIRQAEAALAKAIAERDGAKLAWDDAVALRDNPQDLNLKIDTAQHQLDAAEHAVQQAIANKDAAEANRDLMRRLLDDAEEGKEVTIDTRFGDITQVIYPLPQALDALRVQYHQADTQWWAAWTALGAAQAQRDQVKQSLANLEAMRDDPQTANAQVNAAEARYHATVAAVDSAQTKLNEMRSGATPEEIAAAQAQVEQAQASMRALQVQRDKMTLRAPRAGMITARSVHRGEMAVPGTTLLTLTDLDKVTLTLYIAEDQIGRVRLGQTVTVTVDSFPGRVFVGEVSYISPQAEFTPKSVQTKEERVKTVFTVKVRLANPQHDLKPGMPADAIIATGI